MSSYDNTNSREGSGASLSIADRIRRFRESAPMSREDRASLEFERSGRSTGERERMWWEETGPVGASLKYDPDLLGADESTDYSENYPNTRRMQKRGESASLIGSDTHGDTLDDSAYPLGSSTVPKPSHAQPIPTLHRAHSSDVPERTRGSSGIGGAGSSNSGTSGTGTGGGGGGGTSQSAHQPIRNALRDTTAEDIDLEDRYSHLVSKREGGNRGRTDMDIDFARQRQSGGAASSRGGSAVYSSGGFLSQSAHSDVSLLIAGSRRSIEQHESIRSSLASQEASGVGNFPNTRIGGARDSHEWDRSLDLTSTIQDPEQPIQETRQQQPQPMPFLSAVAADAALDSQVAGKLPVSPSREQEEEAYGKFRPYNTFESSLLSRPPPQPPRPRIDVAPIGAAVPAKSVAGIAGGIEAVGTSQDQDLDNSDVDLGASFQRLLLGLRQDEERIQRIIAGEEEDDGKGNMGGQGGGGQAAAAPINIVPQLVATAGITGIALQQRASKGLSGSSNSPRAADGISTSVAPSATSSPRPTAAIAAANAVSAVAAASAALASPETQLQNEIEAGIFAEVAAQNEKTKNAREIQIKQLARYQEQWQMIGESFSVQEKARDGNMTSAKMHMYVGEHIPAADHERLEDRRRAAESTSAIAGARPQGEISHPLWEDRGQHRDDSKDNKSGGARGAKMDEDDEFYGERMDLAALTIGAALQHPYDPDALKSDHYRNREALAFEQARAAEIKKKHDDEQAVGPHKGQRWEGLRATDLFNPHQPKKIAAQERAAARAKTSVPGMTAPIYRVGAEPVHMAGQNTNVISSSLDAEAAIAAAALGETLPGARTPKRQRNSTRFDRTSGPGNLPYSRELPNDVVRVFQKGQWELIHHVPDAVAAAVMVNKAAHKFKAKLFQNGKWANILHDGSHQFITGAHAANQSPMQWSPEHKKQISITATDTVVTSIQTAVGSFLTGNLPGSPASKNKQTHDMAASLAIGVLGAGLHNAQVKAEEQAARAKITKGLSRPLATSFVDSIFERAASPKRAASGGGGGERSSDRAGNKTHVPAFPDVSTPAEAEAISSNPGYKVFQKGQWVLAEHHDDELGIHTSTAPVGGSALAAKKFAQDTGNVQGIGYKVFQKGQWVVADHHDDHQGISTATAAVGASALAKSAKSSLVPSASEPRDTSANAGNIAKAQPVAARADIEVEALSDFTSEAELALQVEIERVRARLGPSYAQAEEAAKEARRNPPPVSEPICPSSPGRVHPATKVKPCEVSAISGGHVVVPPPLRASLSLAARSEARNWNVYSDDYVNDENAAYTRWADDADYDNDYDSNNLEKVMAHAPVTTDIAGRAAQTTAVLAAATPAAELVLPPRVAPTAPLSLVPEQAPPPAPATDPIPSLITLSAAAVVSRSTEPPPPAAAAPVTTGTAPASPPKKAAPPQPQSYFRFLAAPAENTAREKAKVEAEAAVVVAAAAAEEKAAAQEAAYELTRQQQRAAAANRAYLSTNLKRSTDPTQIPTLVPALASAPVVSAVDQHATAPTAPVAASGAPAPAPAAEVRAPCSLSFSPCSPEAHFADKDKFLSKSKKAREALMRKHLL